MAWIMSFSDCYKMSNSPLEVRSKLDEPRPSYQRSVNEPVFPQSHRKRMDVLVAYTRFTHILSIFIHEIRNCPEPDRDKKDLLDLATHYIHDVMRPFQEELSHDQCLRDGAELLEKQLDELESNLTTLRSDSTTDTQIDATPSTCIPLELLIRCLWPEGKRFSDANAALDNICENLQGLQLKKKLAIFTKRHGILRHADIGGMPKTISFAIGFPFPGKGPLLFLGFTKESWPKKSPPHIKGTVNRENRFSPLQRQKHIDIRNEFYELVKEAEGEINASANGANKEESVRIRAQSVRKFWASHRPECRFSTCRAVSFPDLMIRPKCVICKATSNCPRDNDSSLEHDLRDPQSLQWHIKKDNFDCAEIMTEAGYEDLLDWPDVQQHYFPKTLTDLTLAPPKSSGTQNSRELSYRDSSEVSM